MKREYDLTSGNITAGLWAFALPLMAGNVMRQLYNLVDTCISALVCALARPLMQMFFRAGKYLHKRGNRL